MSEDEDRTMDEDEEVAEEAMDEEVAEEEVAEEEATDEEVAEEGPVDEEITDGERTEETPQESPEEVYDDVDREEDIPLSALRERVEAERAQEGESSFSAVAGESSATDAEESELFEQVDVGDIDGEEVWDAVVEGDVDPEELLGEEPRDRSDAEPAAEPTDTPEEHVIDKREYCQRCEFFSEPPEATCTNEGTEIVELVDGDHFRVRGCPKVAADDEALSGFVSRE